MKSRPTCLALTVLPRTIPLISEISLSGIEFVVEKILFIETQDDYVMIYTAFGKFLKQTTMKYFDDHLPRDEFIRVYRSYIVRTGNILRLEPYGKSSGVLFLEGTYKVPVSRSGYALLKEVLDI